MMKAAFIHHVSQLNTRERWILGVGGAFLGGLLFYLVVLSPISHSVREQSKQLSEKNATLAWLKQVRLQRRAIHVPEALSNSALLTVLAHQLKTASFHSLPYQLEQTGSGDIQLSFDEVPYHAVLSWLWTMSKQYQFSIKQLDVERGKTSGVVKFLLVIH
jgi:general secretion pathway protein M